MSATVAPPGAVVTLPRPQRVRAARKQLQVTPETHALVMASRQPGESADDVINRVFTKR